jgi:signal transduction histidine kinase
MAGSPNIDKRPVRLRDVFEDAATAVSIAAFQKGITLVKEDVLGDEQVLGDPPRLRIALVNVLSNAVKFTPAGGNIEARAFTSNGCVKWVVADNGEGMAPEFIPHIFEQYRQSELASTRHHGGLGLGLTIADRIVKLHQGTIEAESAGLGSGSTFTISIPVPAPSNGA